MRTNNVCGKEFLHWASKQEAVGSTNGIKWAELHFLSPRIIGSGLQVRFLVLKNSHTVMSLFFFLCCSGSCKPGILADSGEQLLKGYREGCQKKHLVGSVNSFWADAGGLLSFVQAGGSLAGFNLFVLVNHNSWPVFVLIH